MVPIILVARGSRHPSAAQTAWALARLVAARRPGLRVKTAFLRHEVPDLRAALAKEAALTHRAAVVVPLLLSDGHFARLVVPEAIRAAQQADLPISVTLAAVLGPGAGADLDRPALELIVTALGRRLMGTLPMAAQPYSRLPGQTTLAERPDAVVVVGAGSRATRAMANVALIAQSFGTRYGTLCRPAHVSIETSDLRDVLNSLRNAGARQIAVAPYFLSAGELHGRAIEEASRCGVTIIAPPLGPSPDLVELILRRADDAMSDRPA
jgi:sirohydrochlorin ferrochelatase